MSHSQLIAFHSTWLYFPATGSGRKRQMTSGVCRPGELLLPLVCRIAAGIAFCESRVFGCRDSCSRSISAVLQSLRKSLISQLLHRGRPLNQICDEAKDGIKGRDFKEEAALPYSTNQLSRPDWVDSCRSAVPPSSQSSLLRRRRSIALETNCGMIFLTRLEIWCWAGLPCTEKIWTRRGCLNSEPCPSPMLP